MTKLLSKTELFASLREIVAVLLEEGAEKIYLFGSYLSETATPRSDIDIGVHGLDSANFFSAWNKIDRISEKKIDLVDFDDSKDFFNLLAEVGAVALIGERNS